MDIRLPLRQVPEGCSGRGIICLGTCRKPVVSGVPQGTVLGPVLFLMYINDLSDVTVHSTARLFADDCIIYRPTRNNEYTILLQNDLNKIAEWQLMWQMQFNIDKCFILRVGRPKHKLLHLYSLHNQNFLQPAPTRFVILVSIPPSSSILVPRYLK